MPHTTNEQKKQTAKNTSFWQRLRSSVAQRMVNIMYGQNMHISAQEPSPIAGAVVFWYIENGTKHYIFAKENNAPLRFPSCLGLNKKASMSDALTGTISDLLGTAFMKSFDKSLLGMEHLTTIPVFSYTDQIDNTAMPVHTLVWNLQITPEQAQLCQPSNKNIDIVAVPEMALSGQNVAQSHRMIMEEIQKVTRKQNALSLDADISGDLLEELLQNASTTSKTIH